MNKMKKIYVIISIIIMLTAVLSGCDGSSNIIEPPGSNYRYTLNGFFVQDVNISAQKVDYNYFAASMTRNTLDLSTAQLFFGNTALGFDNTNSAYVFTNSPRTYRTAQSISINIVDSTLFTDTISTEILDSIWITNSPDSIIPNTNGTPIFVEWTAVLGVKGYIVAVVLTNSAYSNVGYSAYVTEQGTSTTIPGDAFRANINQTLDTGWYDIYVYGYTGSPDLSLSSEILPVALPSQLPDNISHTYLTGHFGSIIVSYKKMIRVVSG